jgi:hypothetical protein
VSSEQLRSPADPAVQEEVSRLLDDVGYWSVITRGKPMKKIVLVLMGLAVCNLTFAQVGTTVTEGAKATAEKAKEAGDETKAAMSSQPDKSVDNAKAKVHKAKAHHHAKVAKEAAKQIPQ